MTDVNASSRSANRSRNALLPTVGILFGIFVVFVLFSTVYTDYLWFRSMEFDHVFTTLLWTRIGLFVAFGLILAAVTTGNAWVAWRLRPRTISFGHPALDRYAKSLRSRVTPLFVGIAAIMGLFGGMAAVGSAQLFLAWRNGESFGTTDPRFGLDIGFFVFDYPWWRFIIGFGIAALVISTIISVLIHYVLGGLRVRRENDGRRSTRGANAHVSILLALTMVLLSVSAWFDRYGRAVTTNDLLTGIRYTDENATLVASLIIAVIGILCAALFVANVAVRRWTIPVVAVVLMMLSNFVLGVLYPSIVQAAVVRPNEPDLERPFIEQHIKATRSAYGVADVEIDDYKAETDASAGQLRADAEALPGLRLMDPSVIGATFDQLQQVRGYYSFPEVLDVDRYQIDGEETDSVVAVRELNQENLPNQSWNNVRTVFTHGYGLVASYGNRSSSGEPEWISKDLPPVGELGEFEPRIYFGEGHTEYSIVGRAEGEAPVELDTPGGGPDGGPSRNIYDGKGGVPIGNWFVRLMYAVRLADYNIVLSERVNPESKIIYDRTPQQRVQAAAPWLQVDSNAYPTVADGRIVWVVDGYTTSNHYPNSERVSMQEATADADTKIDPELAQTDQINYIRNSVKATVDAYDGTVKLYAWDEEDPVLKTWEKAFPGSVTPREEIPEQLLEHLRYPEDLFKVQREILGSYHVTEPHEWLANNDLWEIPKDASGKTEAKQPPYYLQVRWPDEKGATFSQTATFVPRERQNLAAFMSVNADATSKDYGRIRILRMNDATQIDGPQQTFNAMVTNPAVAAELRPFQDSDSARITHGNLLTLPVGGGLLYAMPVYTKRAGTGGGAYPALTFVIVRFGQQVGIGKTLDAALDEAFGGDSGAETGEEGTTEPPPDTESKPGDPGDGAQLPAEVIRALKDADKAFGEADEALKKGDLAEYQKKIEEAREALERAQAG